MVKLLNPPTPRTPLMSQSAVLVDAHERRVEIEIQQLLLDIRRIGNGQDYVTFGALFDDEQVEQFYEALVGTLKCAKKRGLIQYKGQMLLKGMHDKVVISILGASCGTPPGDTNQGSRNTSNSTARYKPPAKLQEQPQPLRKAPQVFTFSPKAVTRRSYSKKVTVPTNTVQAPQKIKTTTTTATTKTATTTAVKTNATNTVKMTTATTTTSPKKSPIRVKKRCEIWGTASDCEDEKSRRVNNLATETPAPSEQHTVYVSSDSEAEPPVQKSPRRPGRDSRPRRRAMTDNAPPSSSSDPNTQTAPPVQTTTVKRKPLVLKRWSEQMALPKTSGSTVAPSATASTTRTTTAPAKPVVATRRSFPTQQRKEQQATKENAQPVPEPAKPKQKWRRSYVRTSGVSNTPSSTTTTTTTTRKWSRSSYTNRSSGATMPTTPTASTVSPLPIVTPSTPQRTTPRPKMNTTPPRKSSLKKNIHLEVSSRVQDEVSQLILDIRRVGPDPATVTFGELFDDDVVQNTYEALVGTLRSAKRRGLISYKGQMLLKGMHDDVVISVVE